MKIFFDERCLAHEELSGLLKAWREIVDFVQDSCVGLSLALDGQALEAPVFLQRFNRLGADAKFLYAPMLFGTQLIEDWRPDAIGSDSICQLDTENDGVIDAAVCEVYEHKKTIVEVALFGHDHSSFADLDTVRMLKLEPPEASIEVDCGTGVADLQRVGSAWGFLRLRYDVASGRPPRDNETVLGSLPARFGRVGRFERNGRRNVYRELATDRLFYVDNLHTGGSAHLEVFNSDGEHLGIADLTGVLDPLRRVPGRRITW